MFAKTNSFITLRSKNIMKKGSPLALRYRNLLKVAKTHNHCLNNLTIFATGSEGRSYGFNLHPTVQRGILDHLLLLRQSFVSMHNKFF